MLKTTLLQVASAEDLAPLQDDWQALLLRSPKSGLQHSLTYARLAVTHALARGEKVYLSEAWDGAKLVGIWPLTVRRVGLFLVMAPAGCGSYEEYSAPLVEGGDDREATAALLHAAMAIPCDIFSIHSVGAGSPLDAALSAPLIERHKKRVGQIEGFRATLSRFADWDAYARQSRSSALTRVHSKLRRLRGQGLVEIGWCKTQEDVRAVLSWAFGAKRAWLNSRRKECPWLENDRVLEFFVDLSRHVDLSTTPLVTFVKIDGRPIAAEINLTSNVLFESLFSAYDEQYEKYSPGNILIEYTFRYCIKNKLDYDFRMLRATYKEKLSDIVNIYIARDLYITPLARTLALPLSRGGKLMRRIRRAPRYAAAVAKDALKRAT